MPETIKKWLIGKAIGWMLDDLAKRRAVADLQNDRIAVGRIDSWVALLEAYTL